LDRRTREIIAYQVGEKSREEARKFWQSFPAVYRQCATIYSAFVPPFLKGSDSKIIIRVDQ
jgi:insertion element IS1 protein InsB